MPYGPGTYGSKRGRPKKQKNGSPKRRKAKRAKRK